MVLRRAGPVLSRVTAQGWIDHPAGGSSRSVIDRRSNGKARGYLKRTRVKDAFQLRINAYRVLLTRGRDACVVFVPPLLEMDETYGYLAAAGFKYLERSGAPR